MLIKVTILQFKTRYMRHLDDVSAIILSSPSSLSEIEKGFLSFLLLSFPLLSVDSRALRSDRDRIVLWIVIETRVEVSGAAGAKMINYRSLPIVIARGRFNQLHKNGM